jgi:hypothetical protein
MLCTILLPLSLIECHRENFFFFSLATLHQGEGVGEWPWRERLFLNIENIYINACIHVARRRPFVKELLDRSPADYRRSLGTPLQHPSSGGFSDKLELTRHCALDLTLSLYCMCYWKYIVMLEVKHYMNNAMWEDQGTPFKCKHKVNMLPNVARTKVQYQDIPEDRHKRQKLMQRDPLSWSRRNRC